MHFDMFKDGSVLADVVRQISCLGCRLEPVLSELHAAQLSMNSTLNNIEFHRAVVSDLPVDFSPERPAQMFLTRKPRQVQEARDT